MTSGIELSAKAMVDIGAMAQLAEHVGDHKVLLQYGGVTECYGDVRVGEGLDLFGSEPVRQRIETELYMR